MTMHPQARDAILKHGLKCRCPRCGKGRLFNGFLTLAPRCEACGLDYSFADPADGPAFFIMIIMGIPAAAFGVWVEIDLGAIRLGAPAHDGAVPAADLHPADPPRQGHAGREPVLPQGRGRPLRRPKTATGPGRCESCQRRPEPELNRNRQHDHSQPRRRRGALVAPQRLPSGDSALHRRQPGHRLDRAADAAAGPVGQDPAPVLIRIRSPIPRWLSSTWPTPSPHPHG